MRCLLFLTLLMVAQLNWVNAAVVEGLYNASVVVSDQSTNAQKKAVKQALAEVLVKVSGNRALLNDQEIKSYLNNAQNILLSYAYESTPEGLLYKAEFDVNKVESVLRSTGFSIWGKHRPQTLAWIAIEEKGTNSRKLLTDSIHQNLIEMAKETAQRRGIEVAFPVMDLTDIQQVSVYDVWSSYTQNLVQASERYDTEYVMSGRLFYRDEQPVVNQFEGDPEIQPEPKKLDVWVLEWIITRRGAFDSGEVEASSPELAMQKAIDMVADELAAKYAIEAVAGNSVENKTEIVIGNISSLTTYMEVLNFLNNLSVVIDVRLIEQQGSFSTFELELFGAKENLDEAFRLDNRMQSPMDDFSQHVVNKPYFWRP
ncbi:MULTISPECIES: DUF2066 domain-containing protein [Aliiglaciecola]|uniref:DUF2066 domain-containing protein n=1 Tax=Aliiglaciecola TaxID=1406885 RepID=UPI001C089C40|nr:MULTISPECIES: DUF2066 domain-containing protein [Aliiglaciecola]MBU2877152.1 DUF2066 domain-containing protein [Aliiglaciecola lipolytica]MDO6712082.1 DUF2066 domain-containing protein [Aliiglaciecola sp. 2_MG-2023]MDO6753162.1 DUF2066 domain-containing protein [Aliiglaciecola sp. 1_MG-2023]